MLGIVWLSYHNGILSGVLLLPIILLLLAAALGLLCLVIVFVPRLWYKFCCGLIGEEDSYSIRDPLPPKQGGHW